MTDRLTKDDWLKRGLKTLATDGAHALKVGPMAEKLRVSRGSFYWHFKDVADFQSQILRRWQEHSTDQVIRDLETAQPQPDRLKQLMKRAFAGRRDPNARSGHGPRRMRPSRASLPPSTRGAWPISPRCWSPPG